MAGFLKTTLCTSAGVNGTAVTLGRKAGTGSAARRGRSSTTSPPIGCSPAVPADGGETVWGALMRFLIGVRGRDSDLQRSRTLQGAPAASTVAGATLGHLPLTEFP